MLWRLGPSLAGLRMLLMGCERKGDVQVNSKVSGPRMEERVLPLTELGSMGKKQMEKSGLNFGGPEKLSPKAQGIDVNPLCLMTPR